MLKQGLSLLLLCLYAGLARATEVKTMELKAGRTYRAKNPRRAGTFGRLVNDRAVIWVGSTTVQYDGPAVPIGGRYPTVSREKFLAWAARDVTDELPPEEYATWPKEGKPS